MFLCVLRDSALKRQSKFNADGGKIRAADGEFNLKGFESVKMPPFPHFTAEREKYAGGVGVWSRNQSAPAVFAFKPANHIFKA